MHVTYFAVAAHFRGIIAMESIGVGPPLAQFNTIMRFLISPALLSSTDTVANADLMPSRSRREVLWVTLTSMKTTVLMRGFFP